MQRPVPIGLLLCEQVIFEEGTRNVTPVNCFSSRTVPRVPSDPSPFVVFALLTDGTGEMTLEIVIERLDTLDVIYRRSYRTRFPGPLHEIRCLVRIADCSWPITGQYQVLLLAENEVVAQRKLRIISREEGT